MSGSRFRHAGSVLVVVMILLTTISAPATATVPSGDTQPSLGSEACSTVSGAQSLANIFGLSGFGLVADAAASGYCASETAQSIEDGTTDVTQYNVVQAAAESRANADTYLNTANNSLQNLQTTLFAYGQSVQISEIKNGSSAVQANVAVNRSIDDRVTKMQINQLESWNQYLQSLHNLGDQQDAANLSIATYDYMTESGVNSAHTVARLQGSLGDDSRYAERNVTLANGTVHRMLEFHGRASADNSQYDIHLTVKVNTSLVDPQMSATYGFDTAQMYAERADGSKVILLSGGDGIFGRYLANWQTLQRKADLAKQNLAAGSSSMVSSYEAGQLNLSDAISPLTYGQEYATQYDETGNLAYARAAAASAGYAVPDLQNVSVMSVREDNITYTGALFSQYAPDNGTWRVNQTYDAANISGVQVVATTGGTMHELSGEFSITSMKTDNGEAVTETSVREYAYQTANVSQYQALQEDLNALRETVAKQTTGGSSGAGSGTDPTAVLIVAGLGVAALAVVIVLQRD